MVFDCSAQFNVVSLNDYLLQRPDFMNDLLGILCRFCKESVAFMTDIKSMFHQIVVAEEHRDLLCFLRWLDGDPSKDVINYRMKVHPFGASSSSTLRTLLTEVECMINSSPLSVDNFCDAEAPEPLTPNHLLTMKPKGVLLPPGKFQRTDMYCRRRWRRVLYLENEFWLRWQGEYLQMLQVRQKWVQPKSNLAVGDIVISKESERTRHKWPLGEVVQVYPSDDGYVRKVRLLMEDGNLDDSGKCPHPPSYLDRPIHKLVLSLSADEVFQEDIFDEATRESPSRSQQRTIERRCKGFIVNEYCREHLISINSFNIH